eukprot:3778763-Prymnesium_polylepis.1
MRGRLDHRWRACELGRCHVPGHAAEEAGRRVQGDQFGCVRVDDAEEWRFTILEAPPVSGPHLGQMGRR